MVLAENVPTALDTHDRITLGSHHVLQFVIPGQAAKPAPIDREAATAQETLSIVVSLLKKGPMTVRDLEARIFHVINSNTTEELPKEFRTGLRRRLATALHTLENQDALLVILKDDIGAVYHLRGTVPGVPIIDLPPSPPPPPSSPSHPTHSQSDSIHDSSQSKSTPSSPLRPATTATGSANAGEGKGTQSNWSWWWETVKKLASS